jgi:hypothetical protein
MKYLPEKPVYRHNYANIKTLLLIGDAIFTYRHNPDGFSHKDVCPG